MKKFEDLKTIAEQQIVETLKTLPSELQVVADISIILEEIPSSQDQAEGIDRDILGLFVGPTLAEKHGGGQDEASHILLYLENIWEEAGQDNEIFAEEVEITLLHELGHYLNWDEYDLEERGLG